MFGIGMMLVACSTMTDAGRGGRSSAPGSVDRARRFDHVQKLVRENYYAADLHGLDWHALCDHYRPLAAAASDDDCWYQEVNTMLGMLRDAHTRAEGPRSMAGPPAGRARLAAAPVHPNVRVARVDESGVLYLRFDRFDRMTVRWLRQQLDKHADARGCIIDLRENRGGLIDESRRAIGIFFREPVPTGVVVTREGRRSVERAIRCARPWPEVPLALLIGKNSHSSAEVFAYAMKYHGRAVLVGQTTAGEVLGARPHRLDDGGELYVSETDFQCLEGGRLEGSGVEPDVVVPRLQFGGFSFAAAEDLQLTVAARLLQGEAP